MARFNFIDLFSGIGGFHLGIIRNGGECVGYSEIDKSAIESYCINHKMNASDNLGDIRKIDELPNHDFLVAGVPCQSWSIAGKNLGFDDDRGQLWDDTIYLLKKNKPKAFLFENVKGLIDPRNKDAFAYILKSIKKAGYHAKHYVINSFDHGVVQNRVRVYIVGFREKKYLDTFKLPKDINHGLKLFNVINGIPKSDLEKEKFSSKELFGEKVPMGRTRFQKVDEVNDFFLFNDIRNGHTTIHSWDIIKTTDKEKEICYTILKNRRKKVYGVKDGNPLSLGHLKKLIEDVSIEDLSRLVNKKILKEVPFSFEIVNTPVSNINEKEIRLLSCFTNNLINLDELFILNKELLLEKISYKKILNSLLEKNVIKAYEIRYDFKNSKISSGINGVNRIYMPNSNIFSTLVASDTNDFVATQYINYNSPEEYKQAFIKQIYLPGNYRKITKEEACLIQGFPKTFILPEKRPSWMKLLGNSVSVPVIEGLTNSIVKTGVFE